jgi:hypothetical protein
MVIVMKKTNIPISSYTKGSLFLSQLNYVIGADKLAETVKGTTTILSSSTRILREQQSAFLVQT